ncbi:hypothetical protein D0Y65_048944 [Glycine soja]|uniref:Retrotransposon Copia-like N-terminal domain-containing protein n=1 Tax=Glycine soja TaxID=3848 RepID=A0A445FUY3_GLYSO|nr:hypothetical protein D0Y65_048944 [Glycine soja]
MSKKPKDGSESDGVRVVRVVSDDGDQGGQSRVTLVRVVSCSGERGVGERAILVSPPLNGDNFHSWSHAMRRALLTKNKHKFKDETITTPINKGDPLFDT